MSIVVSFISICLLKLRQISCETGKHQQKNEKLSKFLITQCYFRFSNLARMHFSFSSLYVGFKSTASASAEHTAFQINKQRALRFFNRVPPLFL
jgi:hypothetical protein